MKFFKKGELKLLWPFYARALIFPMLFFMNAFIVVYFMRLGFSLFQISLLTMMAPLFMLIFEIPTGAIADIYGRKFSVLFGNFIVALALFSVFFLKNYYALLVAFAVIGIGNTFRSGADEAWVTDLIKSKKKTFLHGFFAKNISLNGGGVVVSGLLGAFLVKTFGLSIMWIMAGASYLISMFLLSFGEEKFVRKKADMKSSFKKVNTQSVKSINYTRKHPILVSFLFASSILVFASAFAEYLSWTPFLKSLGFPDYAFGYVWSAIGLAGVFAPIISTRLMGKGRERKFILIMIILGVLTLSFILLATSIIFAFSILFTYFFFLMMRIPAERVYFHKFVPSKLRATVGSVEAVFIAIIGIIAMPLVGLSVDNIGARYSIFLSAIIMVPAAIIYYKLKEDEK